MGSVSIQGNDYIYLHFFTLIDELLSQKLGGKWRMECLDTGFPLPTPYHLGKSLMVFLTEYISPEASRDAGEQVCDCNHDKLEIRFPLEKKLYFIFSFFRVRSATLSSATK